jgi:hypothetical protein
MSISAVSGVAQTYQKTAQPPATPTPPPPSGTTPFGQQLNDVQSTQPLAAAHGHHHHRGGGSQSATGTPPSTAGASPTAGTATSSLLNLIA